MKTLVIIEIEHRKPIPALANLIAGRAWSIDGVAKAEVVHSPSLCAGELQDQGFTLAEIMLGAQEVCRG